MSGRYGIDPNTRSKSSGQCIGQAKHGIARGRVREIVGVGLGYLLVEDVHHTCPVVLTELLIERANQQHRRSSVYLHVSIPVLGVDAIYVIVYEQRGIVDDTT